MHRVVITHADLAAALRGLLQSPGAVACCPASVVSLPDGFELLAGPPRTQPARAAIAEPSILVALVDRASDRVSARDLLARVSAGVLAAAVDFRRRGMTAGYDAALHRPGGAIEPIELVQVIGPGMPLLRNRGAVLPEPLPLQRERWSRLIGALGETVWDRLHECSVAVVGAGRTGSLVATSLARMGVRELALIDPDRVELHNLDAMDGVGIDALGEPKARALTRSLRLIQPALQIHPCVTSITALAAFPRVRQSDLLVTCVDDDGARWVASCLATLYLRPHIDIGTGIFGEGAERQMGADVRLLVPGDGCILCVGGLTREEQVAAVRQSYVQEVRMRQSRHWRAERAGSLRSLNQLAAGLAIRLVEDFLAGRIRGSTWIRLSFSTAGEPSIETVPSERPLRCPLCALRGRGDGGIAALEGVPHLRATDPPLPSQPGSGR